MRIFIALSLISISAFGCKSLNNSSAKDIRISGSGDLEDWVEFSKDHVLREEKGGAEPMIVVFECESESDEVCSKKSPQFEPVTRRAFEAHLKNALGVESYVALEEELKQRETLVAGYRKEIRLAQTLQSWLEFGTEAHKEAAETISSNEKKIADSDAHFRQMTEEVARLRQIEARFNDAMACIETKGRCERASWQNKIKTSDSKNLGRFLGLFVEGAKVYNRKNYYTTYFNNAPKSNVSYQQAVDYCRSLGSGYQLPNADEVLMMLQYFGPSMVKESKIWTRMVSIGNVDTETTYGSEYARSTMRAASGMSGERYSKMLEYNGEVHAGAEKFRSTFGVSSDNGPGISYFDGSGNRFEFEPGPDQRLAAHAYCVKTRFKDHYQSEVDNITRLFVGQAFLDRSPNSSGDSRAYYYEKSVAFRYSEEEARAAVDFKCKNTRASCLITAKKLVD